MDKSSHLGNDEYFVLMILSTNKCIYLYLYIESIGDCEACAGTPIKSHHHLITEPVVSTVCMRQQAKAKL